MYLECYLNFRLCIYYVYFKIGIELWKENEIRFVFIGKIGLGKSVIGNIIFGIKNFKLFVLGLFIIRKCL